LQLSRALTSAQPGAGAPSASRHAPEECRTRIQTIALIHEKLNQSQDVARLPFSEYARDLARGILKAAGATQCAMSRGLAVARGRRPVDKAPPCGLILNELITNALRHAFPDGRTGTIRVGAAGAGGGGRRLRGRGA